MTTTIKDIAKKAGVSYSTVSRALQGSPLISQETTGRIRQIAAELGFHPSAIARSLKTNSTRVLGVVVRRIDDPFFSEIIQGIEDIAQSNGYSLFIAASQNDLEREKKIVRTMVEHRTDGVIICSTSFGSEQSRELTANNRPIVVVNNHAAEDYRYSIYHDYVDGSQQVTRHMVELGHKKIAYISNSLSGRISQERLAGFQQEMGRAGLPVPANFIVEVDGGGPENGRQAIENILALPERPTAIFCFNDMIAIGVLQALQEKGFRVPDDFSVAGFDNILFSEFTTPPLTTLDTPKRFIGMEAARLLGLLKSSPGAGPADTGTPVEPRIQRLKGRLLVRKSTAPPAS